MRRTRPALALAFSCLALNTPLLPGLLAASLVGCGGAPAPAAGPTRPVGSPPPAPPTQVARGSDEAAARAAGAALDAWHDAAARSDEAAYFDLLDEDGVFLGTDATERWNKEAFRDYAKKPFANGRGWIFKATRRALQVSRDGELAFFDEDLASPKFPPTRGSGVLVKRGESWKVLQYVLSMTIPNDRFDAVRDDATAAVTLLPGGKLAPLAWLAGTWASDDRTVELTWSPPRAGTMVGTLRIVDKAGGETQSLDALRIEASDKGAAYTAERKGRAAALRYEMEPLQKPAADPKAPTTAQPKAEPKTDQVTFLDALNQVKLTFSRDADGLRIVVERKGKVEETTLLRRAVVASSR